MFLENYPRKSIMKFSNLLFPEGEREGVWLKYEDLENPKESFQLLLSIDHWWTFSRFFGQISIVEDLQKVGSIASTVGSILPMSTHDLPEVDEGQTWISLCGKNVGYTGASPPFSGLAQGGGTDRDKKLACKWSTTFKEIEKRYGCVPDGFYPFLNCEGHKFRYSYISLTILVAGGYIFPLPYGFNFAEKAALFPFENGLLSFHKNLFKKSDNGKSLCKR